jgi:hypothetical protein
MPHAHQPNSFVYSTQRKRSFHTASLLSYTATSLTDLLYTFQVALDSAASFDRAGAPIARPGCRARNRALSPIARPAGGCRARTRPSPQSARTRPHTICLRPPEPHRHAATSAHTHTHHPVFSTPPAPPAPPPPPCRGRPAAAARRRGRRRHGRAPAEVPCSRQPRRAGAPT